MVSLDIRSDGRWFSMIGLRRPEEAHFLDLHHTRRSAVGVSSPTDQWQYPTCSPSEIVSTQPVRVSDSAVTGWLSLDLLRWRRGPILGGVEPVDLGSKPGFLIATNNWHRSANRHLGRRGIDECVGDSIIIELVLSPR